LVNRLGDKLSEMVARTLHESLWMRRVRRASLPAPTLPCPPLAAKASVADKASITRARHLSRQREEDDDGVG